jgi:hypothetical protein
LFTVLVHLTLCFLQHHKLTAAFSEIVTNPARYDPEQGGRLTVVPLMQQRDCVRCPLNLCKGAQRCRCQTVECAVASR